MNAAENQLATLLARNWWVLLLRGLVAIVFGVLAWLQPAISLAALVLLFGAYTMADGVLGVWAAVAGRREDEHWWLLLPWGLLGIGIGVLTLLAPGIAALALLFYIAAWAIATGVLQIVAAIRLRREISGEWLLVLGGLASVLFGVLLMVRPGVGALSLIWLIASYAVVFGILLVLLAFKVRSFAPPPRYRLLSRIGCRCRNGRATKASEASTPRRARRGRSRSRAGVRTIRAAPGAPQIGKPALIHQRQQALSRATGSSVKRLTFTPLTCILRISS